MPKKTRGRAQKEVACCEPQGLCICKTFLAVLVIILVWISQATWSKAIITIAAILIVLLANCPCKIKK